MSFARVRFFDANGDIAGQSVQVFLPDYLDWADIRLKTFWFLKRGFGEPEATHMLIDSQGAQLLKPVTVALRHLTNDELKEITNGLESTVQEYARQHGFERTPRNQ